MMNKLHITNGDSAADIIKACGVGGDVLSWRDPMHHGPFLAGVTLDQQSRIRVDYLTGKFFSPSISTQGTHEHDFSERDLLLAKAFEFDEIVLWFEHDLLDQLQLIHLLDWFARHDLPENKLSLICINKFDGIENFRGIGVLSPTQMASLFNQRQFVTENQLSIARNFWAAFCSSTPVDLLELISTSTSGSVSRDRFLDENKTIAEPNIALPFLMPALIRHCQEYPWTVDGLTRSERQLLSLVSGGVSNPHRVFIENMNLESCLYIGDWRTYRQLAELASTSQPLIRCKSGDEFVHPYGSDITHHKFVEQELVVTEFGRQVLENDLSAADTIHRDFWLGGVHLSSDKRVWFWNDDAKEFSAHSRK